MPSIQCTHCGATVKTAAAPTPGKKIKCSKCGKAFAVPEEEEESEAEEAAVKPKKGAKASADDAAAPKKKSTGMILAMVGGGVGVLLLCCCGGGGICLSTAEFKDFKLGKVDRTEKPAITTTAEDLARELLTDEAAFKKKYSPRRVEAVGEVQDVYANHFTLKGAKKAPADPFGVNPSVSLKDHSRALRLGKGQKVKVTGLCHSQMEKSIQIYDAEVALDGPKAIIEISAADLAKEYEANSGAAEGKYKDKDVLVTGVVADQKDRQVHLTGTAKTKLSLNQIGDPDKIAKLSGGQKVEMRGRVQMYYKDQGSIGIMNAIVVSK
ncbi:MAG TPA: hypothetical protein VFE62_14660 [Gemmataceae bacterium]|nr:hypothetical protein [Gemmataceae bacterium]